MTFDLSPYRLVRFDGSSIDGDPHYAIKLSESPATLTAFMAALGPYTYGRYYNWTSTSFTYEGQETPLKDYLDWYLVASPDSPITDVDYVVRMKSPEEFHAAYRFEKTERADTIYPVFYDSCTAEAYYAFQYKGCGLDDLRKFLDNFSANYTGLTPDEVTSVYINLPQRDALCVALHNWVLLNTDTRAIRVVPDASFRAMYTDHLEPFTTTTVYSPKTGEPYMAMQYGAKQVHLVRQFIKETPLGSTRYSAVAQGPNCAIYLLGAAAHRVHVGSWIVADARGAISTVNDHQFRNYFLPSADIYKRWTHAGKTGFAFYVKSADLVSQLQEFLEYAVSATYCLVNVRDNVIRLTSRKGPLEVTVGQYVVTQNSPGLLLTVSQEQWDSKSFVNKEIPTVPSTPDPEVTLDDLYPYIHSALREFKKAYPDVNVDRVITDSKITLSLSDS